MIIMVPCYACTQGSMEARWRGSKQPPAAGVCRACDGTGRMSVEETLQCSECRLKGKPESLLVYQDTIGRLAVWRCSIGHVWTNVVGARTGEHR